MQTCKGGNRQRREKKTMCVERKDTQQDDIEGESGKGTDGNGNRGKETERERREAG